MDFFPTDLKIMNFLYTDMIFSTVTADVANEVALLTWLMMWHCCVVVDVLLTCY